jgi:hypothetical protein
MMVDGAFQNLRGSDIYQSPDGVSPGAHAMVVVGYDDSRGAFKLINSWGVEWGENGFGWVAYQTFRQAVREGYVVQDIVAAQPDDITPPVVTPTPVVTPNPVTPPPVTIQQPMISLGAPTILHNVQVPGSGQFGFAPGMQIGLSGVVNGAAGRNIQIVVKFNYLNGPPLFANPMEMVYRDVGGLVATGTQPMLIGTDSETLNNIQVTIPYYALNFPPTNGFNLLNLSLTAIAYIDYQQFAQSAAVPFQVRW